MRIIRLSVLFVVLLVSVAEAADQIGSVIALQGKASAAGADGKKRVLKVKSAVFMNDKIVTAEKSKLQVMFKDETVISQGEKSEIVIDEYVYTPGDKEKVNCSLSAVKGVFRMVTGKITKLNPERFKVKTRMATIGIRGCEMGFRISQQSENVYIIELGDKESVMIETKAKGLFDGLQQNKWGDSQTKKKLVNVLHSKNAGTIVSISGARGIEERDMTPADLAGLVEECTPQDGPFDPNLDLSLNQDPDTQGSEDDGALPPPPDGEEPLPPPGDDGVLRPPPEDEGGLPPPPEEDTALLPPPGDDTGLPPPPDDGTGLPPADGDTAQLPPPDEGDPLLLTPGDDGLILPPPDEGDPLLPPPPPDDDTALLPPPDGGLADPLLSDGGTEPLLSDPLSDPLLSDGTSDPFLSDGGTDPLLNDGGTDPFLSGGGGDPVLSDGGTDPLLSDGPTDPLLSDGPTDPLLSDGPMDPLITTYDQPPPPPPPPADDQLQDPPPPPPPPPSGDGGTTENPPPPPPPPTPPSAVFVAMGGGADWDWGIWELEGVVQSVAFQSPSVIAPVDFASIAAGTTMYNLSGSGNAAAVVHESGVSKLMEGGCNLNVQVGQGSAPNWNGVFSLSTPSSDTLSFNAGGLIQTDGLLTGSASSYTLNVNGTVYNLGTLTGQTIDGHLVGSGMVPTPISGAIGTFHFQNSGGAATVNGGFGADLF